MAQCARKLRKEEATQKIVQELLNE
jgi:hypothetical protein